MSVTSPRYRSDLRVDNNRSRDQRDGLNDRRCMFSIAAAGFLLGDTTAFLKGTIGSGANARCIAGDDRVDWSRRFRSRRNDAASRIKHSLTTPPAQCEPICFALMSLLAGQRKQSTAIIVPSGVLSASDSSRSSSVPVCQRPMKSIPRRKNDLARPR